ncbi:hypothetical protein V8G54_010557 [Vigna mungo]|uniref:Cation efflux protein transmembrane domain-containing protein n=1 Tax=Vigna mungo TaxID=3915 RepID=A0AAQ3NY82_VIGMU
MEAQSSRQMEIIEMSGDFAQNSQQTQVIETSGDFLDGKRRRICGEAPCGFADVGSISKDSQERSSSMRKLVMALIFCVIFMIGEVVGGIKADSLVILTDAAHLLSDVAAFAISLFSLWAAGWEATTRHSYGFFRIEILGALVSIQLIWCLAGILVYEAINRIIAGPKSVNGFLMFLISAFGFVVNIIMALLLGHNHGHKHGHQHGHNHDDDEHHHTDDHTHHHDDHHSQTKKKKKQWNINVQGAFLHVLGDCIPSCK